MNHPEGHNDISKRLKKQFFIQHDFPLSIEGIYGPIVRLQFILNTKNHSFTDNVKKLSEASLQQNHKALVVREEVYIASTL